jgi:hypothetical protein
MSEVMERLNLNRLLPAKKPVKREPPPLVKLYLVAKCNPPRTGEETQESREREMIFCLKLKAFFNLSDFEIKRIYEELEKKLESFVKYYESEIGKAKASKANKDILKGTVLAAKIRQ